MTAYVGSTVCGEASYFVSSICCADGGTWWMLLASSVSGNQSGADAACIGREHARGLPVEEPLYEAFAAFRLLHQRGLSGDAQPARRRS